MTSLNDVTTKLNTFSFELYSVISTETNRNIAFSPYSIYTTLAMLCVGAGGKTRQQIEQVLQLGKEKEEGKGTGDEIVSELLQQLQPLTEQLGAQTDSTLNIANRLWVDKKTQIQQNYQEKVEKYFRAKVGEADFSEPEPARENINKWVSEHTGDKIRELFPSGSISTSTALVLANAIFFKGAWDKKFDKSDTRDFDFFVRPRESVQAKFMYLHDRFPFFVDGRHGMTLLEIPYAGKTFSMVFAMPLSKSDDEGVITDFKIMDEAMKAIENKPDTFRTWLARLEERGKSRVKTDIYVPRFNVSLGIDLSSQLKSLGMREAFEPGAADFQHIGGGKMSELFVSSAFHKSFVMVDEEGTTAAGATGLAMNFKSMPAEVFLNHPFLFFLVHKQSGAIIFSGQVHNPLE